MEGTLPRWKAYLFAALTLVGDIASLRTESGTEPVVLLARIDLWTFTRPGLAQRREDIEPNVQFELERFSRRTGRRRGRAARPPWTWQACAPPAGARQR